MSRNVSEVLIDDFVDINNENYSYCPTMDGLDVNLTQLSENTDTNSNLNAKCLATCQFDWCSGGDI